MLRRLIVAFFKRWWIPGIGNVFAVAASIVAVNAGAEPATRMSVVQGAGGIHLLVAEAGKRDGPGILFIHGFAQSYLSFERQFASKLKDKYHLVAFDLRGEGGSEKPWDAAAYGPSKLWADDVAAVIKATGLERPVIVGWSYGGYVALDYVRHYGTGNLAGIDLVGSLGGLAGPPPHPADSQAAQAMLAKSNRQRALDLVDVIDAGAATAEAYASSTMTADERRTLFATEMMMPAYVRRAMLSRVLDNRDVAPSLTIPVLLTRGSGDVTMPEALVQNVLSAVPTARVSFYADTGHLTFVEHEDRFDTELADFATSAAAR